MTENAELLAIREDIEYRFQPANPITQAISEKLCLTIYKERHCEQWIDKAQNLPPQRINALSADERVEFRARLSHMRDKLRALRRRAQNYCIALGATEQVEFENFDK